MGGPFLPGLTEMLIDYIPSPCMLHSTQSACLEWLDALDGCEHWSHAVLSLRRGRGLSITRNDGGGHDGGGFCVDEIAAFDSPCR